MKNLIEYDKESILSEEVFIEIFEQEDEILKANAFILPGASKGARG